MTDENQTTGQQTQNGITLEQLQQVLGGFKEEISRMVTGAVQKSQKSLEGKLNQTVKEQLATVLDEVIPGADDDATPQQPPAGDVEAQEAPSGDDSITAKLQAMLQAQTQQMEQKLTETTQQYEQRIQAMQQAVDQERRNTAMQQARNQVLDPIRDQLHSPDSFWADIERMGATYDAEKGGYGVAGKDEFENPTWTPLSDKLPDFQKQLSYQFKPRPGAGTGTQPGQSPAGSPASGTGIYSNGHTEQDRVDAVKRAPDPFAAIAKNIASASAN